MGRRANRGAALRRRTAIRNTLHTLALLGTMGGLLFVVANALLGGWGALVVAAVAAAALLLMPRLMVTWRLRQLGARPTRPHQAPWLHGAVHSLAERAQLPRAPTVHVIPSPLLQAMALGDADEAALVVTTGLLRGLGRRELYGVLAHEMSHLEHGDTRVMRLAAVLSELTRWLAQVGLFAALLMLPLVWLGLAELSLLVVLVLVAAPPVTRLLLLALSRTREFEADARAAELTGDPAGLALALATVERVTTRSWLRWLNPLARQEVPPWLRTHPDTWERIDRLMAMTPEGPTRAWAASRLAAARAEGSGPPAPPVRVVVRPW